MGRKMEAINKITNCLKILRNTQVSPSLRIPQGVQVLVSRFFGKPRTSIRSTKLSCLLVPALTLVLTIFGFSVFSNSAYAASYINVSSGSGGTVSLGSIKPSSTGVSASGSDTLTITTNCSAGYSVYVSGQEGKGTSLTNSSASTNNTISASSTAVGSTATTLNSNTWGITGDSSNASTSKYVGLPSYANATDAALITVSSADTSGDNKSTVYYGVKVDTSLTPGTYSGDVLYTTLVTSACNNYTVKFNANGGTGTMSDQTIPVGEATSLSSNSFTRSGYMFLGWSTSEKGKTGTAVNGIGTAADVDYKDGEKVTDLADFNFSITLYAIWSQITGTMQDFQCTDLASGTTTYLTDARDNQVYSVYRIPTDQTYAGTSTIANIAGKCLMTKDLNLGAVNSTSGASSSITANGTMTLSPDDTGFTAPTGSGQSITIPTENVTISNGTGNWGSNNGTYNTYTNKKYTTSGEDDYASRGYYSWGAAMVVCPKNWRLPISNEYNNNNSWENSTAGVSAIVKGENAAATISSITSNPYSFVLGGDYDGNFNSAALVGYYWSATQGGVDSAYRLYMDLSSGLRRSNSYKYHGFAVRCIAENNYTISYSTTGADTGEPSKTSEVTYESGKVTMPTVGTMTKSGYDLKGWALTSSAIEATYAAEQTVAISDLLAAASSAGQTTTPGSTITLYPVWELFAPIDDGELGLMQDYGCASITPGHTATLTDARDNQKYTVYRIPDDQTYKGSTTVANIAGKCIMTQDLSLGYVTGGSITKGSNLVLSTDTSAGSTTSIAPIKYVNSASGGTGWDKTNSDTNLQYTYGPRTNYEAYSSHSYYSFGAAQKVCPRGWRLPTSEEYGTNDSSSAATVGLAAIVGNSADGATALRSSPWNFVFGGYFINTGFGSQGSSGLYWSSTQNDATTGYSMNFNSSSVSQFYHNKDNGRSVRCISEPTEVPDCSSTVHPTAATGCKMKDDNIWIIGNSNKTVTWNALCDGSGNCNSAAYCPPSDYTLPTRAVYLSLISAQGSGSQLYSTLGLFSLRRFWSTTQYSSTVSHTLNVSDSSANVSSGYGLNTYSYYVLCYKSSS